MKPFKIHHFKKLTSTFDKAKEFISKGVTNAVIVSDIQTKGTGRFDRFWVSKRGGLYFSIILKPKNIEKLNYLTIISALSILKTLKNKSLSIKWPNDVLFNNKKICGILTKSYLGKENYAVVGVGINLNQKQMSKEIREFSSSLRIESGEVSNKKIILREFLKNFSAYLSLLSKSEHKKILEEYKQNCSTLGKEITAKTIEKEIKGKAVDVNKEGMLIIKTNSGELITLNEADVSIKKSK